MLYREWIIDAPILGNRTTTATMWQKEVTKMRANKKMSKPEKHPEIVYHAEVDGYPVWIYGRRGRRAYVVTELLKSEYPRSWRTSSVVPMEFTKACRHPEWAAKLCVNLVLGYEFFDMWIPGFPVKQ